MRKRSRDDILDIIEGTIKEMGPLPASLINSALLEKRQSNKSMYISPGSIGCWLKGDKRFEVVSQDKKGKNVWGLRDASEQVKN